MLDALRFPGGEREEAGTSRRSEGSGESGSGLDGAEAQRGDGEESERRGRDSARILEPCHGGHHARQLQGVRVSGLG